MLEILKRKEKFCVDFTEFNQDYRLELQNNIEAKNVFDYLIKPENIYNMIIFSDLNLPALCGIVHKLETEFENNISFSLNDSNNRHFVCQMISYILKSFNYYQIVDGLVDGPKLSEFTNAKLFTNCHRYYTNDFQKHFLVSLV